MIWYVVITSFEVCKMAGESVCGQGMLAPPYPTHVDDTRQGGAQGCFRRRNRPHDETYNIVCHAYDIVCRPMMS
jgi:hypothetical protein